VLVCEVGGTGAPNMLPPSLRWDRRRSTPILFVAMTTGVSNLNVNPKPFEKIPLPQIIIACAHS
jgi:hypothetical protein